MNDRDALLAAILSHPDEDTPRLAYADYLDEHGTEDDRKYAAFIRTQIELADVPEWDARRVLAWYNDRGMLTGRAFDVRKPTHHDLSWPPLDAFRRGFPWHMVTTEEGAFLAAADYLVRNIPLQALTFKGDGTTYRDPVQLSRLLASPHLARLCKLTFSLCRFDIDTISRLRDCPHLTNLRTLQFEFCTLDPGTIRELFKSPLIERLETLEFQQSILEWAELPMAVTGVGGPHRLRRFHVMPFNIVTRLNHLGVLQRPFFHGLRELEILKFQMAGVSIRALCESPTFMGLESLKLVGATPGVPGVRALAECAALGDLKSLWFGGNRIGPVAAKVLAASPYLSGLRVLNLIDNPLADKGAIELAGAPWLRNLVQLELGSCDIGDAGALAIADAVDPNIIRLSMTATHRVRVSDAVRLKLKERFGDRVAV